MANRNTKKRVSKTDRYKEYGIEYRTSDGKVFCDPLGIWVTLPLQFGTNTKIGLAATWSITHGNEYFNVADLESKFPKTAEIMRVAGITVIKGSCPFHCTDCYCDNGNYRYDTVKASIMLRLILATYCMEWLKNCIIAQIKIEEIKQCRIHASGDFFSMDYVNMWIDIAITCDDVIFWTYTKFEYALKAFESITNIFIVPSVTPFGFNFGTCSELIYRYNKLTAMGYKVHICACGTKYESHCADCKTGCKAVGVDCDFVLFIKHSCKGYKAGKNDPIEFDIVCDIIANQNN